MAEWIATASVRHASFLSPLCPPSSVSSSAPLTLRVALHLPCRSHGGLMVNLVCSCSLSFFRHEHCILASCRSRHGGVCDSRLAACPTVPASLFGDLNVNPASPAVLVACCRRHGGMGDPRRPADHHRPLHLHSEAGRVRRAAGPAAGLGGSGRGGECERQHREDLDYHPLLEVPGHGGCQRQADSKRAVGSDRVVIW